MPRGKYIVLEGAEGVGKTTQVQELGRRLKAAGLPVRILREPDSQSDLTARAIRRLTQDPRYPMSTRTEVLLYNAARAQSLQVIKNSVEQGIICIVDRNYLTTLALQYYGRGDVPDYEAINNIIRFAVGDSEPDLCVVMDAPANILYKRSQTRQGGERFDRLDEAFLERVRAGYLWEAKQRNLPLVFAVDGVEKVADDIWKIVTETLALRVKQTQPAAVQTQPVLLKDVLAEKQQKDLEQLTKTEPTESSTSSPSIYTPENLQGEIKQNYIKTMDSLLSNYARLRAKLIDFVQANSQVSDPEKTQNAELEAEQLAKLVLASASLPNPGLLIQSEHNNEITDIAHQNLKETYGEIEEARVTLIEAWPRNELSLAADLAYEYSNLPLATIQKAVTTWPYDQKLIALKSYLKHVENTSSQAGQLLEKVIYNFDIVSDHATFLQIRDSGVASAISTQQLSPRYGYEVPHMIEEAGLIDQFEACFDASFELYGQLQAAGLTDEAQYAVLLGHRMRWSATLNARQALVIREKHSQNENYQRLAKQISEAITEVHPVLGETLQVLS